MREPRRHAATATRPSGAPSISAPVMDPTLVHSRFAENRWHGGRRPPAASVPRAGATGCGSRAASPFGQPRMLARVNAPSPRRAPSRAVVIALIADVIGSVLIVALAPFSWSLRIILVAVWLAATSSLARLVVRLTRE